jgi:hypothetical protein
MRIRSDCLIWPSSGWEYGSCTDISRTGSGDFRLVNIERACPGVGREWIRSLLTDLKAADEFLGHERLVNTLYNAVKPDPAALEFAGRVACLSAIADAIRAKFSPDPADISKVMSNIGQLLDASITGVAMPAKGASAIDLSRIDFEALARRFKESKHKHTTSSLRKWCQRRDLNPRPKAYESSALPLSYSGNALRWNRISAAASPGAREEEITMISLPVKFRFPLYEKKMLWQRRFLQRRQASAGGGPIFCRLCTWVTSMLDSNHCGAASMIERLAGSMTTLHLSNESNVLRPPPSLIFHPCPSTHPWFYLNRYFTTDSGTHLSDGSPANYFARLPDGPANCSAASIGTGINESSSLPEPLS